MPNPVHINEETGEEDPEPPRNEETGEYQPAQQEEPRPGQVPQRHVQRQAQIQGIDPVLARVALHHILAQGEPPAPVQAGDIEPVPGPAHLERPPHQQHDECLYELNEDELKEIVEDFRNSNEAVFASPTTENTIRIKQMFKGYPVRFYAPLGIWKERGSIFVIMEFDNVTEVTIFTHSAAIVNFGHDPIFTGLSFTKRFNYLTNTRPLVIKDIHEGILPVVERTIRGKGGKIQRQELYETYKISRDEALAFEINIPDDVVVRPLDDFNVFQICDNWPHPYTNDDEYVRALVDVNGGLGVYSKSSDNLLSWGVKTMMGQIGFVQTMKEELRKGYASLIVKTYAKEIANLNLNPALVVLIHDNKSQKFFEHLGFKKISRSVCLFLDRREPTHRLAAADDDD